MHKAQVPAASELRCEYLKDLLGIDMPKPDLALGNKITANSTQKNIHQTGLPGPRCFFPCFVE